jgi:hypothetical protein
MIIDVSLNKNFYRGLGDLICLSWISEGMPVKIQFFTGENNVYSEDLLTFFGQPIIKDDCSPVDITKAYENELLDSGSKSRIAYISDFLGINSEIKRPTPNWTKTYNLEKYSVLLFPEVTKKNREWPISYWIDLYDLLNKSGIKTAVCTRGKNSCFSNCLSGLSIEEISNCISNSNFVVSSDSFAAHLSGTLGKKCFVLSGPTKPSCVFSYLQEIVPITFAEDKNCCGCHFSGNYRISCNFGCQMLNCLTPDYVFNFLQQNKNNY